MAFTTATRIKDLIRYQGTSEVHQFDDTAITNSADSANAQLEKMGVPSTETDAGLLGCADRLALSYLMQGQLVTMAVRGDAAPSVDSVRRSADFLRESAMLDAGAYVPISLRKPVARGNRSWLSFPLQNPADRPEYDPSN